MELHFYGEHNQALIEQYQLPDEQLRYTAMPAECIALATSDDCRLPVLVIEEDKLVTFFVLHHGEGINTYTTNKQAILIRAFSTDYREQGKGYAKKALRLLPAFIHSHFPYMSEIILAVNVKNDAAQSLYKNCGFIDEGQRRMGPKGELIIMSFSLTHAASVNK